jgi:hypothetical protein
LNLFVAGWTVKQVGPRLALAVQTIVPAIRVATQILGLIAGKRVGMLIIQSTQIITVVGGPAGYMLVEGPYPQSTQGINEQIALSPTSLPVKLSSQFDGRLSLANCKAASRLARAWGSSVSCHPYISLAASHN